MKKDLEPVTMYHMFAKLFAHLAKEVSDTFGDAGKEAVRRAVKNFGEERGRDIAEEPKQRVPQMIWQIILPPMTWSAVITLNLQTPMERIR